MPLLRIAKGLPPLGPLCLAMALALLASCGDRREQQRALSVPGEAKADTLSLLLQYERAIFPIPSPFQAASLIARHNIPFDEDLLNRVAHVPRYTTTFKKALNLGVYGANLSYVNIYGRTPQSISYLNAIKTLSEGLNLTTAFDPVFFHTVERHLHTPDSLLVFLSRSYQEAHSYLRVNNRHQVGALILAGGWVESLYILTQVAKDHPNRFILNRIGEQKHPLDNLIELLTPYYFQSPEIAALADMLIDLAYEFDGIIFNYVYREPIVDVENRTTHINSETRVIMSEYHLRTISHKISGIRAFIVE